MQTRIDELEVTANELLSTRESVAHAMKSISAKREMTRETEVQVEKSRLLEAQRTITKLQEQISELHGEIRALTLEENVDSLKRLVEEQALAIAEASRNWRIARLSRARVASSMKHCTNLKRRAISSPKNASVLTSFERKPVRQRRRRQRRC